MITHASPENFSCHMFSFYFLCAYILLLTEKDHLPGGWGPDVRPVSLQTYQRSRGAGCAHGLLQGAQQRG